MKDNSEILSGGLMRLLASNFALLFKARYISWQRTAELQADLRAIVRQDHRDLNDCVDALARMIVRLGRAVPPSYCDLMHASSISDKLRSGTVADMIAELASDHRQSITDIDLLETVLPDNANVKELLKNLRLCHVTSLESITKVIVPQASTQMN